MILSQSNMVGVRFGSGMDSRMLAVVTDAERPMRERDDCPLSKIMCWTGCNVSPVQSVRYGNLKQNYSKCFQQAPARTCSGCSLRTTDRKSTRLNSSH